MDVVATGIATTSSFTNAGSNGAGVFLLAVSVVLFGVAVGFMARKRWRCEPEEEPETESV